MTLIVAGPEGHWTAESLRKRISDEDNGRLLFAGEVAGANKSWLLANCGIFALPSDNENFAIAAAEAMKAGCASILSQEVASQRVCVTRNGGR